MSNEIEFVHFDLLTEKQKDNEDNLIVEFDKLISELVYDKDHLKKAYNYYNAEYDEDQFKFIEDIYGEQTPTSVQFIPLVKTHIDKLIGEFLNDEISPGVTCKDSETLSNINRAKVKKINEEVTALLQTQLSSNLYSFLNGENPTDLASEKALEKLKNDIERDFVSDFEIAVQNVIEYLKNNNDVKLKEKLKLLFLDILVAGQCYYTVNIKRIGELPSIEVHSPFDVFVHKNFNQIEVNKSTASIVRKWLDKREILMEYGRYMSDADIAKLDLYLTNHTVNSKMYYVRASSGSLISGVGVAPIPTEGGYSKNDDYAPIDSRVYPVYHIERLAPNKIELEDGSYDYRIDRYEGIRIAEDIYLNVGKAEHVTRTQTNPLQASLKLNGITFDDRGKKPYSLVLLTADLQDKYNILHFHRDTLIANSGVRGDHLDIATLPTELGNSLPERIHKYITYKKGGLAIHNTAQAGADGAGAYNTQYAGFDDTIPFTAIQAIDYAIKSTEQTVSYITGVFQEALGSYSEKDAVSNVQTGIKLSAIVTKQYFFMLNGVITSLLIDAINSCKITFKKGFVGSLILGNKLQKIFTIAPEHFSFTDYDIHLVDLGKHTQDLETIKGIVLELVKSGTTDVDILLDLVDSKSLTSAKSSVGAAIKRAREENNQLQQATQQLEQLQQQAQQSEQELSKFQKEVETLRNKSKEIEQQKIAYDYEIAKEKNEIEKAFKESQAREAEKRTKLEELQLYDNNPYNDKIRK